MSGTATQVPTPGGTGSPAPLSQVPLGTLLKTAAADSKTTNVLLLVVVLCMSGLMPDQAMALCGA